MPQFNLLNLKHAKFRRGRTIFLVLLAVGCVSWGIYALIQELRPPDAMKLRLAAGANVARRFEIAQCLAGEARRRGLELEVVATSGFEESMQQVSEGKLDVAAVCSGIQISGCENIRVLAGLDVAPLHIIVRNELAGTGLSLCEVLKGSRINLGESGTNDHQLAGDILGFLQLRPTKNLRIGDYTEVPMSKEELTRRAEQIVALNGEEREKRLRELPDVVMLVGSLPSRIAQKLFDTKEYCLMPFSYAEPFLLSNLDPGHTPEDRVDRLYLEPTVIHPSMYLGSLPIPNAPCSTVGMRTLLVARTDLPTAVVKRLMESVFETDFARRIKPQTPREITTAYEIHSGANAYLDADKPLLTAEVFNDISGALSIFGAFSAGALSLYGYLRRRRIRRPGEYLEEIRKVDALASGQLSECESPATPEELASRLDARLVKLKEQLIHDYCDNRVQGEMVLMSILSMLADSRTQLSRAGGRTPNVEAINTKDLQTAGIAEQEGAQNPSFKPLRAA